MSEYAQKSNSENGSTSTSSNASKMHWRIPKIIEVDYTSTESGSGDASFLDTDTYAS